MNMLNTKKGSIVLDLTVNNNNFEFLCDTTSALANAKLELQSIEDKITENIETLKKLTPQCDKIDYILAASSGALCGIIDIFLVGSPGESPVGNITDKWFENRTKDFAKLCGWDGLNGSTSSAIRYLEKKFKIPYDQRGAGDAASFIFDLNPSNHHFKSLAHNPTLCGLFFSILDQFTNTSHFVSDGDLIALQNADGSFHLSGKSIVEKFLYAFANWFGHLISDISGSSGSQTRGMGIPSPFWSWTNDVIALKRKLNIPASEFNKAMNQLAIEIYKKGYDARFQTAQAIPVIINELLVRFIYSVRRLIRYFAAVKKENRSFSLLWKTCEPFSNATVKRMLTVAHGTFCLIDTGDALIRGLATGGGAFNVVGFFMRLNIIGVGRFTISLYGEAKRGLKRREVQDEIYFLKREKIIVNDYIEGLNKLAVIYDDKMLLTFVDDLKKSNMYKEGFKKTVLLAEKRNVSNDEILKNKTDIDAYFKGGKNNGSKK